MKDLTLNQRLINENIETIYPENFKFSRHEKRQGEVKLKFNGKIILRPNHQNCISTVKREFNINI